MGGDPTLSPENNALMRKGSLDRLRVLENRSYTPTINDISLSLVLAIRQLILAEEYEHPILSREEAIKVANDRVSLVLESLKECLVDNIKCERGEWIAVA